MRVCARAHIYIYVYLYFSLMFYNMHSVNYFYYFSGKGSSTVYTFNNVSTHHVLSNKINFKLEVNQLSSDSYFVIFLMARNPDVMSGAMYYIQLRPAFSRHYRSYHSSTCILMKCTGSHYGYGSSVTIPGKSSQRYGCSSNSVSVNPKP